MKRYIWLPITLLVLSSLACGLFGRAGEIIDVGRDAATAVAEVGAEIGEEAVATLMPDTTDEEVPEEEDLEQPEIDEDALDRLQSYRMRMTTMWTPEEGEAEHFIMERAQTREPHAQRTVWREGDDEAISELVQIGDQTWICSAGQCTQMHGDPDDVTDDFQDPGMFGFGFMTDDVYDELLGREEVNGIQTRRYELSLSPLQAAFLAEGDVSNLAGEAWIADEADLPAFTVRFEMSWIEERQELTGEASIVYEIYDINAPLTIEPPAGAEATGLPEDVPLYPGAEQQLSAQGMVALRTPDSPSEVGDFYRDEMEAQGWTLDADDEIGDMVQQRWTKGPTTLTILVSTQDGGSGIMLSIDGAY